jgi:hypothetical protein
MIDNNIFNPNRPPIFHRDQAVHIDEIYNIYKKVQKEFIDSKKVKKNISLNGWIYSKIEISHISRPTRL